MQIAVTIAPCIIGITDIMTTLFHTMMNIAAGKNTIEKPCAY